MLKQEPFSTPSIRQALSWAGQRTRGRRLRRTLCVGLLGLLVALVAGAVFLRIATADLVVLALLALPLVWGGSLALAWLVPVAEEARVWLADRAFHLDDRLVTALDPGVRTVRFSPLLADEVETQLRARLTAMQRTRAAAPPARRARRVLRRWRLHLVALVLLALLLLAHGLLGPRLLPSDAVPDRAGPPRGATLARGAPELGLYLDAGRDPVFPRGAPIAGRLQLGSGPTLDRIELHLLGATGARDAVEPFAARLDPGSPFPFDLAPVLRRAGLDGPGRRIVVARGRDPDGRAVESNPVTFRIRPPDSQGGGGGGAAKEPRANESNPPPSPRTPPTTEEKKPDPPAPLGEPRRTPLRSTPRFVLPLLDEAGEVVEKKRFTVRFLPGGEAVVEPVEDGQTTPSFRDVVERYRRRAEVLMDRRGVPAAERDLFLRYLRALEIR